MTLSRRALLAGLPIWLSACAHGGQLASNPDLMRYAYRHDGPPEITLLTVQSDQPGTGKHSALMVNASQRVIFDPAGSFAHENIAERADVILGVTPQIEELFIAYWARDGFHVVRQSVQVPPEVAARALALVLSRGPVGGGRCANAVSGVLHQVPGFEQITPVLLPGSVMAAFADLAGVVTTEVHAGDLPYDPRALDAFNRRLQPQVRAGS